MKKNKVISASAGTGKTYRLSLEYLAALLKDKSLSPKEILVMTFTVRATAEIKQRIFQHLKLISEDIVLRSNLEEICEKKINSEDLKHLNEIYCWLKKNKDCFKVFTIESFIQKVFYCLVAKSLDLENSSAVESLSTESKNKVFNYIFSQPRLHDFFVLNKNKTLGNFANFANALLEINLQEFQPKKIDVNLERERFKQALHELQMAILALGDILKISASLVFKKKFSDFFEKKLGKASEDFLTEFSKFLENEDFFLSAHQELKSQIWEENPIRKKIKCLNKEQMAFFYDSYSMFQVKLKNFLIETVVAQEHNYLLELAKVAQELYNNKSSQELTFYSFGRILKEQLQDKNFLDENKMLREDYWQFLELIPKVLMIDEFQDTSILQYQNLLPFFKIVEALSGSVIIVGDAKQAIYAWRGGEQKLLGSVSNSLPEFEKLHLDTCYRSSKNVVNLANNLFARDYGDFWEYNKVKCASKEEGCVALEINKSLETKDKLQNEIKNIVQNNMLPILQKENLDLSKMAIIARNNNELNLFSKFLEENGITVYQKKSESLLEHKAIKPFFLYLNFLVYDDLNSLFLFLKGAPLFLSGKELDKILGNKELINKFKIERDKEIFPAFIKKFDYLDSFNSQDDLNNMVAFEEILINLDQDILGIANYLQENKNNLNQVISESRQAINLLTIHSSKGLEFDTVFYFLNCTKQGGNFPGLNSFLQYSADFSSVRNSLLTFNYKKLAKETFKETSIKEKSEILNLAYVSLTRAKTNIFIFTNFDLKKMRKESNENSVWDSLAGNLLQCFDESEIEENNENYFFAQKGNPIFCLKSDKKRYAEYSWQKEILQKCKSLKQLEEPKINKENALYGEMVHFYLSYIKWNTKKEQELAEMMTLNKFGKDWKKSFLKIDKFLEKNSWLYDKKKWGIILCEYPIFSDNLEYRLDRVMISPDKKKATIVDFKTGDIFDPEQLENYKKIFQKYTKIPTVDTIFLKIS